MRRVTAVMVILVLSLCAGAAGLAQQDPKPAKTPKPASFEEVLRPFIGMKCTVGGIGPRFLDFAAPRANNTLDMVGTDFLRLSRGRDKTYYPFTSIKAIFTR